MITPDLARGDVLKGIGFIPRGPETQIYSVENHDLNLVATAEITLGGLYAGQTVDADDLPIKLCGISHCFRTEAGAAGRASRGLYRVHQFTKVEMFAFTKPDQSEDMLNYFCDLESGRPIGRFEVIRHKFADMATKIEAAKQLTHTVAWRFANGEYQVREISMAKLYAARVCHEVADECVQIFGGYGYMKEYENERAFRDQRLNRIGAGTDEIMLDVIGRSWALSAATEPAVTLPIVPTDEEAGIRAAVRGICESFGGAEYHRRIVANEESPTELWNALAEKGYLGVNLPERYGGGGLGMHALQMVGEEISAAGCSLLLIVVSPAIVGSIIARHGTESQRELAPGSPQGRPRSRSRSPNRTRARTRTTSRQRRPATGTPTACAARRPTSPGSRTPTRSSSSRASARPTAASASRC